jgi:hypothetical protein
MSELLPYKRIETQLKVKFTLEQSTRTQRWSRGMASLFLSLGVALGGLLTLNPGRFTPGKDPVPIV